MDSPRFTVLDVGHGNCTIVSLGERAFLVDSAPGSTVQEALSTMGVKNLEFIVISHADADHIGGVVGLLLDDDITINTVYVNPDSRRSTQIWKDFRVALKIARERSGTRVVSCINQDTESISFSDMNIEVLSPCPIDCLTGPGTRNVNDEALDANGMSVVLKILDGSESIAIIPGDMNENSLNKMIDEGLDIQAKILVFPHHGGLSHGANVEEFSMTLMNHVKPDLVLFSNGRNRHNNPRKEIIDGIERSQNSCRVACTQLSVECDTDGIALSSEHLDSSVPSKGSMERHCCAGSVSLNIFEGRLDLSELISRHDRYIQQFSRRKCIAIQ